MPPTASVLMDERQCHRLEVGCICNPPCAHALLKGCPMTRATAATAAKKAVSFHPDLEHAIVGLGLHQYTDDECVDCWFTAEELEQSQQELYAFVCGMELGKHRRGLPSRGLDQLTHVGTLIQANCIDRAVNAVLQEVELQWDELDDGYDFELLSAIYTQYTQEATKVALVWGLRDQLEVERIHKAEITIKKSRFIMAPTASVAKTPIIDSTSVITDRAQVAIPDHHQDNTKAKKRKKRASKKAKKLKRRSSSSKASKTSTKKTASPPPPPPPTTTTTSSPATPRAVVSVVAKSPATVPARMPSIAASCSSSSCEDMKPYVMRIPSHDNHAAKADRTFSSPKSKCKRIHYESPKSAPKEESSPFWVYEKSASNSVQTRSTASTTAHTSSANIAVIKLPDSKSTKKERPDRAKKSSRSKSMTLPAETAKKPSRSKSVTLPSAKQQPTKTKSSRSKSATRPATDHNSKSKKASRSKSATTPTVKQTTKKASRSKSVTLPAAKQTKSKLKSSITRVKDPVLKSPAPTTPRNTSQERPKLTQSAPSTNDDSSEGSISAELNDATGNVEPSSDSFKTTPMFSPKPVSAKTRCNVAKDVTAETSTPAQAKEPESPKANLSDCEAPNSAVTNSRQVVWVELRQAKSKRSRGLSVSMHSKTADAPAPKTPIPTRKKSWFSGSTNMKSVESNSPRSPKRPTVVRMTDPISPSDYEWSSSSTESIESVEPSIECSPRLTSKSDHGPSRGNKKASTKSVARSNPAVNEYGDRSIDSVLSAASDHVKTSRPKKYASLVHPATAPSKRILYNPMSTPNTLKKPSAGAATPTTVTLSATSSHLRMGVNSRSNNNVALKKTMFEKQWTPTSSATHHRSSYTPKKTEQRKGALPPPPLFGSVKQ